jgi:predicted homoserine dehydrogenase-like protein
MYNAFMDGTKVAVESCAIANALGLRPDTRGMHHPTAAVADAPAVFRPESEGGVLATTGVVDCLDPTDAEWSGFVVTKTETESQRAYLSARDSVSTAADGAYQLFHVPFHDAQETTVSVARVALDGEPTGVVRTQETEVVAAAKRDLRPGDEIDGGGGDTVYGVLADADDAAEHGLVPFELLSGAAVVERVETDEFVTEGDVELDTESFLYRLRRLET